MPGGSRRGHGGGLQGGWAGEKCICGLLFRRKEKAEGHVGGRCPSLILGGGEGRGGWRRMWTQPPEEHSVQKFLTPSPLPPFQFSPLLPPGRLGIQAVFRPKRPRDITSTAMATNCEVMGSAAYQEGKRAADRAVGPGMSSAPGPGASYSRLPCSKNRTLSR